MKNYLLIIFVLSFGFKNHMAQTQIGNSILGSNIFKRAGRRVALSANGAIIAIGAYGSGSNGYVQVYQNATNTNQWTQLGNDIVSNTDFNLFVSSVAISYNDSVLAVSAKNDCSIGFRNGGNAKVFKNINNSWIQMGDDLNGEASSDYFGTGISLSSDGALLAVGAPGNDYSGTVSGAVSTNQYSNGNWTTFGNTIGGEATGDNSGHSVSLSAEGTILAIGAPNNGTTNGSNTGQLRVYKKIGATWTIIGTEINGETENIKLSYDVSLLANGEILAVGTPFGANSASKVNFYKNNSNSWIPKGTTIEGDEIGDFLSDTLSISPNGTTIAIGSTNHGNYFGQVKVFDLSQLLTKSNSELLEIKIYRNLAKNCFNIDCNIAIEKVTLYNLLGKKDKNF